MSDEEEYLRQMEIQRRNFEAQFGSIEELGYEDKTKMSDTESLSSDEEDSNIDDDDEEEDADEYESDESELEIDDEEEEFLGFDEPKPQEPQPKVIKFKDTTRAYEQPTKEQKKLLKSGKAPSLVKKTKQAITKPKTKEDADNLDNDLELQRFLEESHILSNFQNKSSGAGLTLQTIDHEEPIGAANRHILQSRIKSLSASNGVAKSKLEKMPMSMRKGMIESRRKKISKFEQEAKDGGIVLSKVKKGEFRNIGGSVTIHDRIGAGMKDRKPKHRERGLKIQSVGKSTRNGLIISQREIDRINGSSGGKGRGKKGRR